MSTDVNISDRLAAMNDAWNEAEVKTGAGMPPDGVYQALVNRFDWVENEYVGLQLETEFLISNGEHQGRTVKRWDAVEDKDKIGWVKSHLAAIGLDVQSVTIAELYSEPKHLEGLLDTPVEIRIKTTRKQGNDGQERRYTNVYVNKRLGPPVPRSDIPSAAPPVQEQTAMLGRPNPDDDIPF